MAKSDHDPQADRVYLMEKRALRGHFRHKCALVLLRRWARRLCRLHGVPAVTVIVRAERGFGASYIDNRITLDPKCGRNMLSFAHELAHHVVAHRNPHAQDHGATFMKWYAHLLDAMRLVPVAGMQAICREYGIAIAPLAAVQRHPPLTRRSNPTWLNKNAP